MAHESLPTVQHDDDKEPWDDVTPFEAPDDVPHPKYGSAGAAGIDLCAAVSDTVPARGVLMVGTGVVIGFQEGHYGQIASRSSLCMNNQVVAFPGIIDNDYRGEIKIMLLNHGDKPFSFAKGHKIAQMIICPYIKVDLRKTSSVNDIRGRTQRDNGGFGSTGK